MAKEIVKIIWAEFVKLKEDGHGGSDKFTDDTEIYGIRKGMRTMFSFGVYRTRDLGEVDE